MMNKLIKIVFLSIKVIENYAANKQEKSLTFLNLFANQTFQPKPHDINKRQKILRTLDISNKIRSSV